MVEFNADLKFFAKVGLILIGFIVLASACSPILANFDHRTGYGNVLSR